MRRRDRPQRAPWWVRGAPTIGGLLFGLALGWWSLGPTSQEHVSLVEELDVLAPRQRSWSRGVVMGLGPGTPSRPPDVQALRATLRGLQANSPATAVAVVVSKAVIPLLSDFDLSVERLVVVEDQAFRDWPGPIAVLAASPWQRSLFLTLGVQVCAPLDPMFAWLARYDVALTPRPLPLRQAVAGGGPADPLAWDALNDYSPDVILYDQNPRVAAFLARWAAQGGALSRFAPELLPSNLRIKQLPAEFNLQLPPSALPPFLTGQVRVLNAPEETCKRVNADLSPRLYDPLAGQAVYKWRLSATAPATSPLVAECWADTGVEQANTRAHQAVVPDQLVVPE